MTFQFCVPFSGNVTLICPLILAQTRQYLCVLGVLFVSNVHWVQLQPQSWTSLQSLLNSAFTWTAQSVFGILPSSPMQIQFKCCIWRWIHTFPSPTCFQSTLNIHQKKKQKKKFKVASFFDMEADLALERGYRCCCCVFSLGKKNPISFYMNSTSKWLVWDSGANVPVNVKISWLWIQQKNKNEK